MILPRVALSLAASLANLLNRFRFVSLPNTRQRRSAIETGISLKGIPSA